MSYIRLRPTDPIGRAALEALEALEATAMVLRGGDRGTHEVIVLPSEIIDIGVFGPVSGTLQDRA